jgi:enoyl-CoA hydratase
MSDLVRYELHDSIATIILDDGKVNVMSSAMLQAIDAALDRAEQNKAIVVLTSSRPGLFTAGFDLKTLARNDPAASYDMVKRGAELALRLLTFPLPVVAACNGHAFPMGAFLILASDVRLGADGPFRIGMNEVAIGIPVPTFALELARNRVAPAWLNRTAVTGQMFAPADALTAGFFDRVVAPDELAAEAAGAAQALKAIDLPSHASTKHRLRRAAAAAVRAAIDSELTLESYQRSAAEGPSRVKLPA